MKYLKSFLESTKEKDPIRIRKEIRYKLNQIERQIDLKSQINDLLRSYAEDKKLIKDLTGEYQKPLEILYNTGKYNNIKFEDGLYKHDGFIDTYSIVDQDNNWSYVNKLNTNYSDLIDFLIDFIEKSGKSDEFLGKNTNKQVIEYIKNIQSNVFIEEYKKYFTFDDLFKYTKNSKSATIRGDISESKVENFLKSIGIEVVYRGGNGDLIDMIFGVDLIIKLGNKYLTIQVKSSESSLKEATLAKNKYGKFIYKNDIFICPVKEYFLFYVRKDDEFEEFLINKKGFTTPYPGRPIVNILKTI